jgi:hypothetical protein
MLVPLIIGLTILIIMLAIYLRILNKLFLLQKKEINHEEFDKAIKELGEIKELTGDDR